MAYGPRISKCEVRRPVCGPIGRANVVASWRQGCWTPRRCKRYGPREATPLGPTLSPCEASRGRTPRDLPCSAWCMRTPEAPRPCIRLCKTTSHPFSLYFLTFFNESPANSIGFSTCKDYGPHHESRPPTSTTGPHGGGTDYVLLQTIILSIYL